MGRWRSILSTNVFVIISSLLCFIQKPTFVLAGRFIYGLSTGMFTVFCPKYVSEVSPTEVKGPAGALSQIATTFGILVPFSIGIFFSDPTNDD